MKPFYIDADKNIRIEKKLKSCQQSAIENIR
jgi:hypothetical protein